MGRGYRTKTVASAQITAVPRKLAFSKIFRKTKAINKPKVPFLQEEAINTFTSKMSELEQLQEFLLTELDRPKGEFSHLEKEFVRVIANRIISDEDEETFELLIDRIDESIEIFKNRISKKISITHLLVHLQ